MIYNNLISANSAADVQAMCPDSDHVVIRYREDGYCEIINRGSLVADNGEGEINTAISLARQNPQAVVYHYQNRPPGFGCQPGDYLASHTARFPNRFHQHVLGMVAYSAPLPFDMIWRYELLPLFNLEYALYKFWLIASRSDAECWHDLGDYLSQTASWLQDNASRDYSAKMALLILEALAAPIPPVLRPVAAHWLGATPLNNILAKK